MRWVSLAALYFIIWWVTLFAMLPFGLRTQDDEKEIVPGSISSAPRGAHIVRAMLRTTLVSAVILAVFVVVTRGLGLDVDDIPQIVPRFD